MPPTAAFFIYMAQILHSKIFFIAVYIVSSLIGE
jgi:hypothetical protein